jgi:hypothetical protein
MHALEGDPLLRMPLLEALEGDLFAEFGEMPFFEAGFLLPVHGDSMVQCSATHAYPQWVGRGGRFVAGQPDDAP